MRPEGNSGIMGPEGLEAFKFKAFNKDLRASREGSWDFLGP